MARTLRDRLIFQLTQTRNELLECVSPISDADLDFAPASDGKSYRALLIEIGAMEAESTHFLSTGIVPDWAECEAKVSGTSLQDILESLARLHEGMLAYLGSSSDEHLRETVPIPEDWFEFFGDQELEREELVRWIIRHEYYHLGQMITYRWIQGHNPYQ